MIKDNCLEGVDEVYAIHNTPLGKECSVHIVPGPVMAGVEKFEIEVIGKGGHGAEPAFSIDPITAASAIHSGLLSIKSRRTINSETYSLVVCAF